MAKVKPQPIRVALHAMEPGQYGDCYALLSERTKSQTRDGKPFYTCRFRDHHRIATAMIWADHELFNACDQHWQVGQFVKLRAKYLEHDRYGSQLELENVREINEQDRADGFDEADFLDRSRFDPPKMLEELRSIAEQDVIDIGLRTLILMIFDQYGERLVRLPGSQRHYYPFIGGWLEHTLSVTRNCLILVDRYHERYPDALKHINRDLVIAGAILHDIGRVHELDARPLPELSIVGRMVGHIPLGRDLVRDCAKTIEKLDASLWRLLEHILLSYLAIPEWGSPRLPLIPEVLIIHHADDLDAKLEMYLRCLTRDTSPGPFTERDPILGRALFRDRLAEDLT